MTTVERKEYEERKVLRTISPVRTTRSSTQNLAEFDNNLDYLLEDLQSSVSRPGSSLGNATTYRETSRTVSNLDSGKSNSLSRITHLKPANPVTEYASDGAYSYTSPDGTKSIQSYKKESYSYKTSGDSSIPTEKIRMQNNINQLDSLLDDLQQVKQSSTERGSYNVGGDPGLQNGDSTKISNSRRTVQRELHYGDTPRSNSRSRTLERTSREGSVTRDIQYTSEGTYGDIKSVRHTSPSPIRSNTSTLTKQTKMTNVHSYPVEVVETRTPDINPEILAHLDPHLLPAGNTKVTTTIKTYTYEIPGAGTYPANINVVDNEKYVYSPNQSQTTPSKSFVYNKVENSETQNALHYTQEPSWNERNERVYKETTVNKTDNIIQPYQKPSPPGGSGGHTIVKETITTRNYQPGYSPEYTNQHGKDAYIYNETKTTKNYGPNGYPDDDSRYPPSHTTYVVKETHNTNTNYGPKHPSSNYPPQDRDRHYPRDTEPYGKPNEPLNISYHYKSHSSTTNNYKGYPSGDESQPLLQSRPFPTDNEIDGGPPKRIDELMANIGNEPPNSPLNAGFTAHEAELIQQKKIDSMKQKQQEIEERKKDPKDLPRTKNVTGPPVYYPPAHEMFAKKEEAGAWRAEGGMARESGKYKYEAESKSKSKSSSGAAVVPVCLPLCCGLPCTIL